MTYRDITFCRGAGCIKFDFCPKALTADVQDAADEAELRVAEYEFPAELPCYEAKGEC